MKAGFLVAASVGLVACGSAFASGMPVCTADPAVMRMSVEQVSARARMMGFKVGAVEPDQGCWRVEATDDRGRKLVLRLHAGTGEMMARIAADAVDRSTRTAATD